MRRNKGVIGLALIAALALMVATVGTSASASGGSAVAAKKKCKKKKQADSAKKKKCKKKGTGTGTTTPPISMLRATLTWTGGGDSTDYDLYVFDPSGATGRAVSNPIPKSSFSPNAKGTPGSETFTD